MVTPHHRAACFGGRNTNEGARTFLTSWVSTVQSRGGSPRSGRVQESSAEPWPTTRMTPTVGERTPRGQSRHRERVLLDGGGGGKAVGWNKLVVPQGLEGPRVGGRCGW